MKYIYENTIEGLFSAIFVGYKNIEIAHFYPKSFESSFLADEIAIKTSKEFYKRVKDSIVKNFGYNFLNSIKTAFRSYELEKGTHIARVLKGKYLYGNVYLGGSTEEAIKFNQMIKNVYSENHSYKGLLRFKKIKGDYFYGEMEPKNDILDLLTLHFKNRIPKEKFIILDMKRKKCSIYNEGEISYYDVGDMYINKGSKDTFFEECWVEFYNAIKIDERENLKLMQNNMPKRYWKYLPEKINNL